MSALSDRRAVLAGLAGCAAAGAAGAVTGSRSARAAVRGAEQSIDDRRILEIAAEFDGLERRRIALLPSSGTTLAVPEASARDEAIEPLEDRQDEIASELATLNASSPQACAAVAACLTLWLGDASTDPDDDGIRIDRALSEWLARNLAHMAGRQA